jgi:hypothetical protein
VLLLDSGSNGDSRRGKCRKKRRCYMTVDFATAASQNGFSIYKLSLIENLNGFARLNCLKSWEQDKRLT